MPNFKLSSSVKDAIITRAKALAGRRVAHMQAEFPLSTATVQEAVMPAEDLSMLRRLEHNRVQNLPMNDDLAISCRRVDFPELARGVGLWLHLPESVFVADHHYVPWHNTTTFNPDALRASHSLQGLAPEDRQALVKWLNRVVRERRLEEIANATVFRVLDHCASTGQLLATWPMLATLVQDPFWQTRLRNPPRKLKDYAPDAQLMALYTKRMAATEVFLTSAEMLEEYVHPPATIRAHVLAWERLASDPSPRP